MDLQEYYKFQPNDYYDDGFHYETGKWFMDLIKEFEHEFNKKFPYYFANYLFANSSTMLIINKAMDLNSDISSGMDLIDGEINLDANLEIEKYSRIGTVYAIGSKITTNEDEPIFLVIDDEIANGLILLKYISDDDSKDFEILPPVNKDDRINISKTQRISVTNK